MLVLWELDVLICNIQTSRLFLGTPYYLKKRSLELDPIRISMMLLVIRYWAIIYFSTLAPTELWNWRERQRNKGHQGLLAFSFSKTGTVKWAFSSILSPNTKLETSGIDPILRQSLLLKMISLVSSQHFTPPLKTIFMIMRRTALCTVLFRTRTVWAYTHTAWALMTVSDASNHQHFLIGFNHAI